MNNTDTSQATSLSNEYLADSISLDTIDRLESQVDIVVKTMTSLQEENQLQHAEIKLLKQKLEEFGGYKHFSSSEEVESLREENKQLQEKLEHTETRIREMLTRLDFMEEE